MAKDITINNYGDDAIQVLEGLEAVRKRPGMYIGSTDGTGLHHLVWEIVDNAVDEALSGFGDQIDVVIHADGSLSVTDHGRGMPTGQHAMGIPTVEVIFTVLHAGGKFGQGGYKTSGGLHGVGSSVVNALSTWLEVEITRDGKIYRQRFEDGGKPVTTLEVVGKAAKSKTGTKVTFKPDDNIFSTVTFKYNTIAERLNESAFLLKDVTLTLTDERDGQTDVFHYENGVQDFVSYLNEDKETLTPVLYFEGQENDFQVEVALQYNDGFADNILSFVNNVRTKDGGSHETGFKSALTKAMNDYARKTGLLKEKDKNLEGSDYREGLSAVLSILVPEEHLQFEGQTKDKLGTPMARPLVDAIVSEKLTFFLLENGELANTLVRKAIKARDAREAARKARDLSRSGKKKKDKGLLSGKLTPAQSRNPKKNELYLVEGDSAGGSAKQGRDRKFQAILPLRGKVLNTEKAKMADILKNEEINTMVYTIGAGVGADFTLDDINYDKIIIMTDADTDGAHIQTLLLTFFYRYMRPLVEAGHVYIALPPLYKMSKGKGKKEQVAYAWTDGELEDLRQQFGKGANLQRYKGLGEMNADQLWETTMNPESRTLIRVTIEDLARAERRVSVLMGDKPAPRRQWIEDNVRFTLEENSDMVF
ncbi:DNA topoisomerase IV subunit B [Streptococcus sp. DD12]|uniref:DNA topoisomerase IV subunit B n=1 Tax=Streptococcus sp. DD12 TaxID=1777880 RepID=UPI0007997027|nr:DNA topoisomerase IV subunit B [Streptococcus sp. DD12]KXT76615.1 Topoisomerase IV subunit B [Streptococcus sp. DD12]